MGHPQGWPVFYLLMLFWAYHEHQKFRVASPARRGIDQRSLDEYYGTNAHQRVRIAARA